MVAAAVIAAISFGLIVWQIDPYSADVIIFALLSLSFLMTTLGVLVPSVYFYKLRRGLLEPGAPLSASVRQGGVASATLTLLFVMQLLHVLTWWNAVFIIAIVVILDIYLSQ